MLHLLSCCMIEMLDFRIRGIASSSSIEFVFNAAAPGGVLESPGVPLLIRLCENVGIRRHVIETYLELYPHNASDNFDVSDFIMLLRHLGWSGPDSSGSDLTSESSSNEYPSPSRCATQQRRNTGGIGQFTLLSEIPLISILTWLSTRSLRLLSRTCSEIKLLTDSQRFFLPSTCVASESRRSAVGLARLYSISFQERFFTKKDASAVIIPAQLSSILSFLRDAIVREFAEEILIHMDLPVVCTDVDGGLLGRASNSMLRDWCILSNELTGMTLYNITSLKIIVSETKQRRRWRERLTDPVLSAFEERLYEAWAASAIATVGTFPNLVSLTVDVQLHGASREFFWCALRVALKERYRLITKLRLQSVEEEESARPVGMRYMDYILEIALKFTSVQPRDFSGPAEIMDRWHEYHDFSKQFLKRIRQRMDT